MTYKQRYNNSPALAALPLSAWSGVLILEVIHEVDDYVITCYEVSDDEGTQRSNYSKVKLQYNGNGRSYFRKQGVRYYLDEFIKAGRES